MQVKLHENLIVKADKRHTTGKQKLIEGLKLILLLIDVAEDGKCPIK